MDREQTQRAVLKAIQTGDKPELRRLIKEQGSQAILEMAMPSGLLPVHLAACFGQTEILELLLQKYQANPNTPTASGITPLLLAAATGYLEATIFLLENGADPRSTTAHGSGPHHLLADYRCTDPTLYHKVLLYCRWSARYEASADSCDKPGFQGAHRARSQRQLPNSVWCDTTPSRHSSRQRTSSHGAAQRRQQRSRHQSPQQVRFLLNRELHLLEISIESII